MLYSNRNILVFFIYFFLIRHGDSLFSTKILIIFPDLLTSHLKIVSFYLSFRLINRKLFYCLCYDFNVKQIFLFKCAIQIFCTIREEFGESFFFHWEMADLTAFNLWLVMSVIRCPYYPYFSLFGHVLFAGNCRLTNLHIALFLWKFSCLIWHRCMDLFFLVGRCLKVSRD